MTTERQIIEKQKELIGYLKSGLKLPISNRFESEIADLEKELEQEAITDTDIELHFKTGVEVRVSGIGINPDIYRIEGAKAFRDNEIKHIK